jgi:DNA polymerase-3 subunit chi
VTEVRFYHLQRRSLDDVLPPLLEKARERGFRIVVRVGSEERVRALNGHLWSWRPETFLAHGSAAEGSPEAQPIWLTALDENPNEATMLVAGDGVQLDEVAGWQMVCDVFDGNDEAAVAAARQRWKRWKDQGHALTYWQQTQAGWEKKA